MGSTLKLPALFKGTEQIAVQAICSGVVSGLWRLLSRTARPGTTSAEAPPRSVSCLLLE